MAFPCKLGDLVSLPCVRHAQKVTLLRLLAAVFALGVGFSAAAPLEIEGLESRINTLQELAEDNAAREALPIFKEALSLAQKTEEAIEQDKVQKQKLTTNAAEPLPTVPEPLAGEPAANEKAAHLARLNSLADTLATDLARLENKAEQAVDYFAQLTEALTTERAELAQLQAPAAGPDDLSQAKRELALQRIAFLEASIARHTSEQALFQAETDRLPERIRQLRELLTEVKSRRDELKGQLDQTRLASTRSEREQLRQTLDSVRKIPELKPLVASFDKLLALPGRDLLQKSQNYLAETQSLQNQIADQERSARRRLAFLEKADLPVDTATSLLLRSQRDQLPSLRTLQANLRQNVARTAEAQITLLTLQNELLKAPRISPDTIAAHPELTPEFIDDLLNRRSRLLSNVSKTYRQSYENLIKATSLAENTIAEVQSYSNFLDERLLWIKSTGPLTLAEPVREWERFLRITRTFPYGDVPHRIWQNFKSHPFSVLFLIALGLYPIIRRRQLYAISKEQSEVAALRSCTSIRPTLLTIGTRFLLAARFPALLAAAALLFTGTPALTDAILRLAVFLFFTVFLGQLSYPGGLLETHFRLPATNLSLIKRSLRWIIPSAGSFVFLVALLTFSDSSPESGRFVFLCAMAFGIVVGLVVFSPKRSVLWNTKKTNRRMVRIGFLFTTLAPLALLIAAALGWYASVLTLRSQIIATLALLVAGFLVVRFLTRWILVSRRRLAITQALRKREAQLAERNPDSNNDDVPPLEEVKAAAVDVVEVEEQITRLVRVFVAFGLIIGVWIIWASTLPALNKLDDITVWGPDSKPVAVLTGQPEKVTLAEPATAPAIPGTTSILPSGEDKAAAETVENDDRVSLQDLLLAAVLFALTVIAARNIPGVLSLAVFNRLNLGPGGNFALTTTARYFIIVIGLVWALGSIGITWSKVQWLAAAITLGIGFGLQEIFANFVAGLILLYERPIRLGDLVTVNNISGKVTQIQIRATTIMQFNNRELIVPNKEFITGQLVNWTLKDPMQRADVVVGVAYGSDTRKVEELLYEIANGHPEVTSDPAPQVHFQNFGDNALTFELRTFVPDLSQFMVTKTELHHQVAERFAAAGLEIAFPQRDLHLRSLPPALTEALGGNAGTPFPPSESPLANPPNAH